MDNYIKRLIKERDAAKVKYEHAEKEFGEACWHAIELNPDEGMNNDTYYWWSKAIDELERKYKEAEIKLEKAQENE